jgi:hypothetical protein
VVIHVGDFRANVPRMKAAVDAVIGASLGGEAGSQHFPSARRPIVFLDTTYCDERWSFPSQYWCLCYIIKTTNKILRKESVQAKKKKKRKGEESAPQDPLMAKLNGYKKRQGGKTLFLVGTYSIGKEKILAALAKYCKLRVYANAHKMALLKLLELDGLTGARDEVEAGWREAHLEDQSESLEGLRRDFIVPGATKYDIKRTVRDIRSMVGGEEKEASTQLCFADMFTGDASTARVFVTMLHACSLNGLTAWLKEPIKGGKLRSEQLKGDGFTRVVAFSPTGWAGVKAYVNKREIAGFQAEVHRVPYSEHSSFTQLRQFVEYCQPSCIVPTVKASTSAEQIKLLTLN